MDIAVKNHGSNIPPRQSEPKRFLALTILVTEAEPQRTYARH